MSIWKLKSIGPFFAYSIGPGRKSESLLPEKIVKCLYKMSKMISL